MIKIVAKSIVKEGCSEAFITCARELVEESRKEEGCIEYTLHQDIHNPNILTFIEIWKDQAAIDSHNASKHFTTIVPKLGEFRTEDSEVNLYVEV